MKNHKVYIAAKMATREKDSTESVKDRVRYFIENQGLSIYKVESILNAPKGTLYRPIRNNTPISSKLVEKIGDAFPNLNKAWLLLGEGVMLKTEASYATYPPSIGNVTVSRKQFIEFLKRDSVRDENYGIATEEFFYLFSVDLSTNNATQSD